MKIIGKAYMFVTKSFEELGKKVVKYNSWFLITPIFLTVFLSTGLQRIKFDMSEDYLITTDSVTATHRSRLKTLFPMNISNEFDPVRSLDLSFYGAVTIQATDNRSVLRQSVFKDIIILDEIIHNFTINYEDPLCYKEICAKREGKCFQNKILLLSNFIEKIENKLLLLKYPVEENNEDHGILSLGGVIVDENGYIISAQAITLFYFLDSTNIWKEDIARKWEKLFMKRIEDLRSTHIKINKDISISREEAGFDVLFETMKYVPPSAALMILFTILSCLSPDFLRSKPWLGVVSATATGMSLASGFGILSYIGVTAAPSTFIIPFLVLGIGVDDTFVMLSAWMRTEPQKSIENRISETYKESGISITITSLTNIGSFAAGYFFCNFPFIKIFCIFMTCCLIFDYIFQITFIGAFLVIFGRIEERRLHSVVFVPLNGTFSGGKHVFRNIFCYVQPHMTNKKNSGSSVFVINFWIKVSKWMTKTNIKISIILLYFLYLSIIIWGFSKAFLVASLNTGLIEGSSRKSFYNIQQKYYNQYQFRLQLFIDENLNYADPQVQVKLEEMIQHFESDPLIAHSDLTEWWLKSYLRFLSDERSSLFLSGFNLTDNFDFFYVLRHFFLKIQLAKQFRYDIAFKENYTGIVCSRLFLQTNITLDDNHFYNQLTSFKKKLDAAPYSLILYHPLFYYFDIIDLIPKICRQTFSIIIVCVFVISAILLPSILTIVCILFSIFSVTAGIMSFMFLCGIGLSVNSVTVFVMVIGICVDYAAHISCAYESLEINDANKRLINAVTSTAMPILQGFITTVLAFVLCVFVPSQVVIDYTKIISLACFIAAVHSIVFLPVIMSLIHRFSEAVCKRCSGARGSRNYKFDLATEEKNRIENGVENISMY